MAWIICSGCLVPWHLKFWSRLAIPHPSCSVLLATSLATSLWIKSCDTTIISEWCAFSACSYGIPTLFVRSSLVGPGLTFICPFTLRINPLMGVHGSTKTSPVGWRTTYIHIPHTPVLIIAHVSDADWSFGTWLLWLPFHILGME